MLAVDNICSVWKRNPLYSKIMQNITTKINIALWDTLYGQHKNILQYPNSYFVQVTEALYAVKPSRCILDYGFGSGANMLHLAQKGHSMCGLEVSKHCLDALYPLLESYKISAEMVLTDGALPLPFADARFDSSIAWQVLYYNTPEILAAVVQELDRVTRPHSCIITSMAGPKDCPPEKSFEQPSAVRMCVEREDLPRYFPNKALTVGRYTIVYAGRESDHWIMAYSSTGEQLPALPVNFTSVQASAYPEDVFIRATWWKMTPNQHKRVLLCCGPSLPSLQHMLQRGFDAYMLVSPVNYVHTCELARMEGVDIARLIPLTEEETFNLPAESFDAVVAWQCFPDSDSLTLDIARYSVLYATLDACLKSGGIFLATVPTYCDQDQTESANFQQFIGNRPCNSGYFYFTFDTLHTQYRIFDYEK